MLSLLNSLKLGQTQTSLVGDIVDATLALRVFSVDSTNLELESIADGLEVGLGRDLGETDVDRGTDCGTKVGGAEGQPSKTVIATERSLGFDSLDSLDQALENLSNVSSLNDLLVIILEKACLLHRNDTEMILLVGPNEEGLVLVVENSTSLGPVTAGIGSLEEPLRILIRG